MLNSITVPKISSRSDNKFESYNKLT